MVSLIELIHQITKNIYEIFVLITNLLSHSSRFNAVNNTVFGLSKVVLSELSSFNHFFSFFKKVKHPVWGGGGEVVELCS